jgi:DNA polymerase
MKRAGAFPAAETFFPARRSLGAFRAAVGRCEACPLFGDATQAVFGEGAARSSLMLVGEQPGNQEDVTGRPFVGPAGRLLEDALAEAGIERSKIYITNVVKHFSFVRRGASRIHKTPTLLEVSACMPWLEEEIALVEPAVIVCLGATAARALVGREARVQRDRGRRLETPWAPSTFVTYHPSALLRAKKGDPKGAVAAAEKALAAGKTAQNPPAPGLVSELEASIKDWKAKLK